MSAPGPSRQRPSRELHGASCECGGSCNSCSAARPQERSFPASLRRSRPCDSAHVFDSFFSWFRPTRQMKPRGFVDTKVDKNSGSGLKPSNTRLIQRKLAINQLLTGSGDDYGLICCEFRDSRYREPQFPHPLANGTSSLMRPEPASVSSGARTRAKSRRRRQYLVVC
jgi:hypothetical protein